MTNEQAIEIMKHNREILGKSKHGKYHRNANTIACDIAIKALEKQIPKKVISKHTVYTSDLVGGCCNCGYDDLTTVQGHDYCPGCGQKLDWSDE